MAQERSVRGVLHQAPDQIGNSRQQLAHRQIDAHALAVLNDRLAHRLGHAIEHLHLVAVGRHADLFGRDDRVRQTAQIVTAERRVDRVMAFEQEPAQPLVVGVGFRFVQKNWYRPILLLGPGDLAVPIRAFDEPNSDAPRLPARPANQIAHVLFCVVEIRLQRNRRVRLLVKFGFFQHAAKNRQGQIAENILLHVDRHRGLQSRSFAKQLAQSLTHDPFGIWVERIEAGAQRG